MKKVFLRNKIVRVILIGIGTAMTYGAGFAADAVSLTFQGKDRFYDIVGSFQVEAGPSVAWDVLTGYEQLPQFVGNLKKSQVGKKLGPRHFLLEQEFEGGFLFITKRIRVVLDVHETWHQTIRFEDIDHKDFEFYKGSWKICPGSGHELEVIYSLKAQQNFDAPFAGDYTRSGIKDLLESIRREILRREALAETTGRTEKNKAAPVSTRTPKGSRNP